MSRRGSHHRENGVDNDVVSVCKAVFLSNFDEIDDRIESKKTLFSLLQQSGRNPTKRKLNAYWPEETEEMSFDEFVDICQKEQVTKSDDVMNAFRKIDLNGDGYLSLEELYKIMNKGDQSMSRDEVRALIDEVDENKDGKLDYREFTNMMMKTTEDSIKLSMKTMERKEKKKKREERRKAAAAKQAESESAGSPDNDPLSGSTVSLKGSEKGMGSKTSLNETDKKMGSMASIKDDCKDDMGSKVSLKGETKSMGSRTSLRVSEKDMGSRTSVRESEKEMGSKATLKGSEKDMGSRATLKGSEKDMGSRTTLKGSEKDMGSRATLKGSEKDMGSRATLKGSEKDMRSRATLKGSEKDMGSRATLKGSEKDMGSKVSLSKQDECSQGSQVSVKQEQDPVGSQVSVRSVKHEDLHAKSDHKDAARELQQQQQQRPSSASSQRSQRIEEPKPSKQTDSPKGDTKKLSSFQNTERRESERPAKSESQMAAPVVPIPGKNSARSVKEEIDYDDDFDIVSSASPTPRIDLTSSGTPRNTLADKRSVREGKAGVATTLNEADKDKIAGKHKDEVSKTVENKAGSSQEVPKSEAKMTEKASGAVRETAENVASLKATLKPKLNESISGSKTSLHSDDPDIVTVPVPSPRKYMPRAQEDDAPRPSPRIRGSKTKSPSTKGKEKLPDPKSLKDWLHYTSKGCFFYEEEEIVTHMYSLKIPETSNVYLSAHPIDEPACLKLASAEPVDTVLFVFDDRGKLVTYTEQRDIQGTFGVQCELKAGQYQVLPYTTGCRFKQRSEGQEHMKEARLVKKDKEDNVVITSAFRQALQDIFDLCDLDGNGTMSRAEFNWFNLRTSGEELGEDEWEVVEERTNLENGEITREGFLQLNEMEAEDAKGDVGDLWITLSSMGMNKALIMDEACPYRIDVYVEQGRRKSSFRVSGIESIEKKELVSEICQTVIDKAGDPTRIKGMKDLYLYTYRNDFWATVIIENRSRSTVNLSVDCSRSRNVISNREELNHSIEVDPQDTVIVHQLMPRSELSEWSITCTETINK